MKLLLGTKNLAKIQSFKNYLQHAEIDIVTLQDLGIIDEPLEIGKTFEENALQKAQFYSEISGLPTLSDDGGFEIDALNGQPGVYSKRWAGPNATDEDRINKVIDSLKGFPKSERVGKLTSAIVVYFPDVRDYVSVINSKQGIIPENPSDKQIPDFPYRSVLYLPEFEKFYSELSDDELSEVDHRRHSCKVLLLKMEPYIYS